MRRDRCAVGVDFVERVEGEGVDVGVVLGAAGGFEVGVG